MMIEVLPSSAGRNADDQHQLVSLKKGDDVFTSGGITWRIACGRMIRPFSSSRKARAISSVRAVL